MAGASVDILGSFKVNQWYKLAIYVGAVLIILGFVFVNNPNLTKYTDFAVESLVLGLIAWILDDTLRAYGEVRIDEERYNKLEVGKNVLTVVYAVRWIGLFVWIFVIVANI